MRAVRRGRVYNDGVLAGTLSEDAKGFEFVYDPAYLADERAPAVSLTLPKRKKPYRSPHLFPFFYGLLAEGSLKDLQCRILRIDEEDSFGRLLATAGGDTIGSVTVVREKP